MGLQKEVIEKQAVEVNTKSDSYFLQHAVSTVEKIVNERLNKTLKERNSAKKKEIIELLNNPTDFTDENKSKKAKEKIEDFDYAKEIKIRVVYGISINNKARITRDLNIITVVLPKELEENIKLANGIYNHKVIQKIREITAHELGHILLHMFNDECTPLSKTEYNISGEKFTPEQENEAELFSKVLIKGRDLRNEEFFSSRKEQLIRREV